MKLNILSAGLVFALLVAPGGAPAAVTTQAWWHFGEAGNQADSSGNGHNYLNAFSFAPSGPAVAPTISPKAVGGPLGVSGYTSTSCLRFGLNHTQSSFWNTGYNPSGTNNPGATNYGIEMWFLPQNNGVTGGVSTWVFSDGGGQVSISGGGPWGGEAVVLYPNFDGTVTLYPSMINGPNSANVVPFSHFAIADTNHWIHLALVNINGTGVAFYTNGVLCGINDTGVSFPPAGAMYIGTDGDNQAIDGYIDEERVFTFAEGAFLTNDLLLRPPGPDILGQPANTTVWEGGAANFSVSTVLDPTDTYQWKEAGVNLAGATSPALNLDPVPLATNGTLVAVGVTNNSSGVVSSNATLGVAIINPSNVNAYSNAVATDPAILAYFPMDNDTLPAVANTVDPLHGGTMEGGALFDSQTNRSFGQRALYLTQNGDVQIFPESGYEFGGGSGTVEALVYLTASGASGSLAFFSVASADGGSVRYQLGATTDGSSLVYTNDSPVQLVWAAPVNLLNRLAHVAFTFDHGTNVTAYLDGLSLGTKTQTSFGSATSVPAWIGSATLNVPGAWSGTVDDVAIYTAALSANTIAIHNSKFVFGTNTTGPAIVGQTASENLYAGGDPVLTVTATGTPPLSYQWYSNATIISGATSSALTLVNTTVDSSATYTVTVNNPIGPVANSQPIVLHFSAPPAGYAALIMSHHPSAYWRLDESSGTNFYDVAGGLTGFYTGTNAAGAGPTLALPGAIPGDSDPAVGLGGAGANPLRGVIPFTPVLNPSTAFTVELWGKQNNNLAAIIMGSQFRTGTPRDGFAINVHNGGVGWTVQMGNQTGVTMQINSAQPVTAGNWSHMALVWDGTTAHLYTLGEADGTASAGYLPNFVNPFFIGCRPDLAGPYNGTIDEVVFYNYALTQSQIQSHVDIGLPLFTAIAPATNVIGDSKPVGNPFDGRGANAFWSNSISDGVKTLTGVTRFASQSNSQITLPGYAALSNAQSTISFWMKTAGTNGLSSLSGNEGGIIFNWRPANGQGGVAFIVHDNGTFFVQAMNNLNHFESAAHIDDNLWHYYAVTVDPSISGEIDLYIDGLLDSAVPNIGAWFWPNGQTVEFGRDSLYDGGYWRNLNGYMDDIRFYNRYLTPTEISTVHTTGALVDTSALVLRYNFDAPPNGWIITWPYGSLQAAPSVPGSFTTLTNVVSPFQVAPHPGTMRFFRALQ